MSMRASETGLPTMTQTTPAQQPRRDGEQMSSQCQKCELRCYVHENQITPIPIAHILYSIGKEQSTPDRRKSTRMTPSAVLFCFVFFSPYQ